jgi:hypothetical protein
MERIRMSTRYLTNVILALVAGFLVVATQAFSTSTVSWLALGVGIAVVAFAVVAQLDRSRGRAQRLLDVVAIALGGVTIVFSRVFSGSTVMWLSFAEALGFVGLGITGLTVHEIDGWRAEHHLAPLQGLSQSERPEKPSLAA